MEPGGIRTLMLGMVSGKRVRIQTGDPFLWEGWWRPRVVPNGAFVLRQQSCDSTVGAEEEVALGRLASPAGARQGHSGSPHQSEMIRGMKSSVWGITKQKWVRAEPGSFVRSLCSSPKETWCEHTGTHTPTQGLPHPHRLTHTHTDIGTHTHGLTDTHTGSHAHTHTEGLTHTDEPTHTLPSALAGPCTHRWPRFPLCHGTAFLLKGKKSATRLLVRHSPPMARLAWC